MAYYTLSPDDVAAAVLGGALLGGGGGGRIEDGTSIGQLAVDVGTPQLAQLDDFQDDDLLITVALVGAPAAKDRYLKPVHYVRAVELLQHSLGKRIAGIITNENGAGTTLNGWFQAAMLNIPCVDAPCNGRAHPTGSMGSISLHKDTQYVSLQAAVGGQANRYLEATIAGSLSTCATAVRKLSIEAGGLVAVARNPISVRYAREHCATGAIRQAMELGHTMLGQREKGGTAVIQAAMNYLKGDIVAQGSVEHADLRTEGGFDVGTVSFKDYELTFWNEYMTLEQQGKRLATFPDLIMTLNTTTGRPLVTAEVHPGDDVTIIRVPRQHLLLGSAMHDAELFEPIEQIVHKPILSYVFA